MNKSAPCKIHVKMELLSAPYIAAFTWNTKAYVQFPLECYFKSIRKSVRTRYCSVSYGVLIMGVSEVAIGGVL